MTAPATLVERYPSPRTGRGALTRLARPAGAVPAWALAGAFSVAYLVWSPYSPDLAAAAYRSALFSSQGFTLWDNSWYGGHHLLAYSLLAPGLGALVSPRVIVAVSMTAATALFSALLGPRLNTPAGRIASLWFAIGAAVSLLSSRVPFDLGLAIGLAALLLAVRGRSLPALLMTVLCSLASPVAGAFLALSLIAWALAGPERGRAAGLAAGALAPIVLLAVAFPEGGTQPFVASAFYPALAGALAVGALFPARWRALRIGAALYALALIGSYVVASPVGGNVDRLAALCAGPLAALAAVGAPRRSLRLRALLVLALPLLYWQANAPVADYAAAASDPGTGRAYYRPLLAELKRLGIGYGARPARIEAVPLADHWESRWLAPAAMLARGWERQLDTLRNGLFYEAGGVTPARYRAWLSATGVSYVALPDGRLDYSARAEARLLRGQSIGGRGLRAGGTGAPPAYLRAIWRSDHWRLFAVARPTPLAEPPAALTGAGHDWFTLRAPHAGSFTVLVRFSPYWLPDVHGACVARGPDEWTSVRVPRAASVRVTINFSPSRVLSRGPRCA